MKNIKVKQKGDKFPYAKFKDNFDKECIVMLCSLPNDRGIIFGNIEKTMTFNSKQVKKLLPILKKFAKTGDII